MKVVIDRKIAADCIKDISFLNSKWNESVCTEQETHNRRQSVRSSQGHTLLPLVVPRLLPLNNNTIGWEHQKDPCYPPKCQVQSQLRAFASTLLYQEQSPRFPHDGFFTTLGLCSEALRMPFQTTHCSPESLPTPWSALSFSFLSSDTTYVLAYFFMPVFTYVSIRGGFILLTAGSPGSRPVPAT